MELNQINPAISWKESKKKSLRMKSMECLKPLKCEERQKMSAHIQTKREQNESNEKNK